ncbi:MAG: gliding motility-associated C-terminal domain-containing protein [Flavobacterium sp.]|nr:gliding motility-associated C-terminal domain-containing protein [Flavobacterium sp.]
MACYQTATFNPTTCAYDITGTQPEAPVVACYQTATFNPTTCAYDITGTQPEAPVVACYQTATFNPTTCAYDIIGTQPEAPVVACYETATFNPTTCAYDITGTKPEAPVVACYQTATFNPTTCAYDITGTQPEIPALADITGQCSVTAPKPTYTIACSGTEIVATTNDPLTYTTQGSYVINWKFDDGKGFVQAVSQNVIVKDTEKPVVPQLEDVIGQCTATATVPSALDNCSGNIKGTTNDPLSYSIKGDYVITWTFEDGNGNSATATQNVIVKDNEAPVAPTAPKNETYACLGDVPVAATLTAVDNCDGEINVKGEDAIVQGKCANSFVITRTWTFKDSSGNSSETITQTITVEDNLAPVFNELPATSTISCPAKPEFAEATAIDNCGGAFTLTFEDVTTPGTNGSYSVTRTWKAIDSCGNSSTATQTINVEDKTAPVPPVLEDVKGQCSATATAPIAIDSCVGNVVGTTSDPLTYSTQGTFVIRWTFNDGNGNSFTANQNVIVDDTRAPLAPELADITSQCSATATPPTANDGCAGAIVGTTTDPLKYTLEGTYVIRWTFDDGNGNVTSANQNVVVTSLTDEIGTDGYAKCNADVDLRVDLKALLPQGTPEGGTWTDAVNPNAIQGNIYIPNGINKGLYDLKYVVADGDCSKTVKVKMNVDDDCIVLPECSPIRVYNAVTPNDDGANDFFKIENIEFTDCFPTNKVEIYNRWGVLVFEVNQYDNNSRVFKGISEGRATVNKSSELPTGTYFYIIEYTNDKGDTLKKDGYLYLTR